jgi:hypothetical protein
MHRIAVLLLYVSTHMLYVKTNLEHSKFEALKDMCLAYHNLPHPKPSLPRPFKISPSMAIDVFPETN